MSVSPPGHWLLKRMVFLLNKTLELINTTVSISIQDLLNNANTFKGINTFTQGIDVNNINSINGNTTFNSNIVVDGNILANNANFIGDKLFINDISLKNSVQSYITVKNDIRFNNGIYVNGNLTVNGETITVNSETLTIDDRFIVLNANIETLNLTSTDPAGIIVNTHNSSKYSKGYLLWTLFDPNDPTNTDLNRTWDLSGDNLRGNVLKATTLRGNRIDSYYSPNISVISDIDMNNKDITNITTLTATDLNIDIIQTNNTNYFNIGYYISKYFKVMTINTVELGFTNEDLSQNLALVNSVFSKSKFFTLTHPVNTDIGHWTTGIDLNIVSAAETGIMQDYQNFKFAVSFKVDDTEVSAWNNKYSNTFPNQYDVSFAFQGQNPQTIYIKLFKRWDINFYFIGRWKRKLDSDGNPVTNNINEFDIAIFNSPTTNSNFETNVHHVLDMTITNTSTNTTIII